MGIYKQVVSVLRCFDRVYEYFGVRRVVRLPAIKPIESPRLTLVNVILNPRLLIRLGMRPLIVVLLHEGRSSQEILFVEPLDEGVLDD